MSVRRGATSPAALRLGPTAVGKAYLGPVQVYSSAPSSPVLSPLAWKSGASLAGNPPPIAGFEAWRGRPMDITASWIDNNTAQVEVWSLITIGELADWTKDLDLAVGAIGYDETWAQAAAGACDARWRTSLNKIKTEWTRIPRTGQLYLRFAHEMNGSWYPWKVTPDRTADFITAWRRYRALQQEIFPAAKLVFSVNRDGVNNYQDWRVTWPGNAYVDLCGVDYYNQYPNVNTQAEWDAELVAYDNSGGPRGLEAHRLFALDRGKPLVVSEWANNARVEDGFRDAPFWMQKMYDYFGEHAGTGPGQIPYEIHFNPQGSEDGKWAIWPETLQPLSAAVYRAAWSGGATTSGGTTGGTTGDTTGGGAVAATGVPIITLTAAGDVRVAWAAPAAPAGSSLSGYALQRRSYANGSPGAWTTLTQLASDATGYTDTAITAGVVYGYQLAAIYYVTATGGYSTSAYSPEQTVTAGGATTSVFTETFPGAAGSAWPSAWTVTAARGATVGGATQVNGTGRLALPGAAGYPSLAARRAVGMADLDLRLNLSSTFDTSSAAAAESYREVFLRLPAGADATAGGNSIGAYVLQIVPSSSNPTGAAWKILLLRRTNGVETVLAEQPRVIPASARDFSCHVRLVGNRLRASVWQTEQSEPAWVMDVTDTSADAIIRAGDVALAASGSSVANAGVTVSYNSVVLTAAT